MAAEAECAGLPENLAAAHQLIGKLQHENKWLRHRLDVLSRRLFGKRTEQLTPDQLTLAYEQLDSEIDKAQPPEEPDSVETTPAEKSRPRRGRRSIPKDIRRVDVVIDIPEEEKTKREDHEPATDIPLHFNPPGVAPFSSVRVATFPSGRSTTASVSPIDVVGYLFRPSRRPLVAAAAFSRASCAALMPCFVAFSTRF